MTTLEDIRREHEERFMGEKISRLLTRIAWATAVTYPPEYSDSGTWNKEAIEDLLQDWMFERLHGRRELTRLIKGAASVQSLRAGLTTSLRHFLADRRKKSSPARLFKRMTKLLESNDDFMRIGKASKPADQFWTLRSSPRSEPTRSNDAALRRLADDISNEDLQLVEYNPEGKKGSPELRDPGIKVFLDRVLGGSDGALSPQTLMEVLLARLGIASPETEPFDDGAMADLRPTAGDDTHVHAVAQSVAGRLGQQRARIVIAVEREQELGKAATTLQLSEAEVKQVVCETLEMISAEAGSDDETARIYRRMLETLFDEDV